MRDYFSDFYLQCDILQVVYTIDMLQSHILLRVFTRKPFCSAIDQTVIYRPCRLSTSISMCRVLNYLNKYWKDELSMITENDNLSFCRIIYLQLVDWGQTPVDSAIRVLSLSGFCLDFPENPVRCLSAIRIVALFSVRIFSDSVLSGFP